MVVACTAFNAAFRGAFAALVPLVNELMQLLGWHDVKLLQFHTPGITYSTAHRALDGQQLTPELHFRGHPLQTPQLFLNEARLSALGLAIYLAGRLACTHHQQHGTQAAGARRCADWARPFQPPARTRSAGCQICRLANRATYPRPQLV
jgi:hypothetical protein